MKNKNTIIEEIYKKTCRPRHYCNCDECHGGEEYIKKSDLSLSLLKLIESLEMEMESKYLLESLDAFIKDLSLFTPERRR